MCVSPYVLSFFFFNDTATTEIYTLSLHDALPISPSVERNSPIWVAAYTRCGSTGSTAISKPRPPFGTPAARCQVRSEEHTSELQSRQYLVCRLLLEKKKKIPEAEFGHKEHEVCQR